MAPVTTRRATEDEEDFIEDEAEEETEATEALPATAPVSDRRRRRQMKHGDVPAPVAEVSEVQPVGKERPTPSQRPEVVKSRNRLVRFYQNAVEYVQDTRSELSKVAWLSREDTMRLTYIVLIVTAISAAFLGFVGFLFGLLTQALATPTSTTVAGIAAAVLILGVALGWLLRERLFGGHFE
jgi:preprotein translocase SecE subunit